MSVSQKLKFKTIVEFLKVFVLLIRRTKILPIHLGRKES